MLVGLQNGWLNQSDVAQGSVGWTLKNPDTDLQPVLLLLGCDHEEPDDIRSWLEEANEATGRESEHDAMERWRWAFLADLSENTDITEDAKVDRLQELYAQFGYPADMADCSRYFAKPGLKVGDSVKCPLKAMRELTSNLERRIFG
jgi:hypothetical protein